RPEVICLPGSPRRARAPVTGHLKTGLDLGVGLGLSMLGMTRKPYPTDLTDAQWGRLEPLIPKPRSGTRKGGRPAPDRRGRPAAIFYHPRGRAGRGRAPPPAPPPPHGVPAPSP